MDGKLLHTMQVETKPSGLVYFDPYSEEQMRLFLPEGDHVFRAGFIDDDFVKGLTRQRRLRPQEEQVPGFDHVRGAVSLPRLEPASRKKIFICDPNPGPRLRREDRLQPGASRLAAAGHARRRWRL